MRTVIMQKGTAHGTKDEERGQRFIMNVSTVVELVQFVEPNII